MLCHRLISTPQTYNPQSVSFHGLVRHEIVNPVLPEGGGIVHVRKIRKDGEARPNLKFRNLQALKWDHHKNSLLHALFLLPIPKRYLFNRVFLF